VLDPLWGDPLRAALAAAKPFARVVNLGQSAGAEASLSSSAIRSTPSTCSATRTTPPARSARPPPISGWRGTRPAGEIEVEVERVGIEDVPEIWRRQGSSPNRKLVVVP
jgi:hypothetical protein